jgi:RimJ/RimL family protein N-acetyltransferase
MTAENRANCQDKQGHTLQVGPLQKEHRQLLKEMYDGFDPKAISQGLPHHNPKTRALWVDEIVEKGDNFGLWHENQVVGHAVLVPDLKKQEGELLIFLSKPFRDRGLGAELVRLVIKRAKELKLARILLEVEAYNYSAINLFKKLGFEFHSRHEIERIMVLELKY